MPLPSVFAAFYRDGVDPRCSGVSENQVDFCGLIRLLFFLAPAKGSWVFRVSEW